MLKRFLLSTAATAALIVPFLFLNSESRQAFGAATSHAKVIPATPPPMGWSSWNSFSNTIDSDIVVQQTNAMVSSGMKNVGYAYINIDEGWWLGQRDPNGNIVVDPKQWPALQPGEQAGDMSNIVRFIHAAGLKAGIYTDAGESGCSFYGPDIGPPMPHTGSEGHYDQDFLQFAHWGFDYVKVDWCGGDHENMDPAVQYAAIASAIRRAEKLTGHRLYFSICDWGNKSPWTWAPGIGGIEADIWRTSGDIVDPIVASAGPNDRHATMKAVFDNFDRGIHPAAQHTGFYNDPDMMMVGMRGLSDGENRLHMSLWAISGAPLIVGTDLTKLTRTTREILTNPEVIAVDQDSLGVQAVKIAEPQPGLQVWARPLTTEGKHAVLLLNRTSASAQITVSWAVIGLDPSLLASVRDLWTAKNLGPFSSAFTATVPAGDAVFVVVHGTDAQPTRYQAVSAVNKLGNRAKSETCRQCSRGQAVTVGGEKSLTFTIPPLTKPTFIQIDYLNRTDRPLTAQLRVDGQLPTNVLFPPTGGANEVGVITIEVEPNPTVSQSALSFSSECAPGPSLESISVLAAH
jgi:alpha galactosidase A-like protein/alpha galactosidase C-like protein